MPTLMFYYLRTHGHPPSTVSTILRYLMLGWRPDAITSETFVDLTTIRMAEQSYEIWQCHKATPFHHEPAKEAFTIK